MKKITFSKYLPLFFLLCFSGNPIITSEDYSKTLLVVYTFLFSFYTLNMIGWRIEKKIIQHFFLIISFITILVIAQLKILGSVSYPGVFAFILKIFLGLVTILYYKYESINVLYLYIKIMVFLVIVSIPLFIINQFGSFGIDLTNTRSKSIIIFTTTVFTKYIKTPFDLIRNASMFWEPGAFSGYLNLALVYIIMLNKGFRIGKYKREILWIGIGIFTSMSTAGYIIFGIFFGIYVLKNYKWGKIIVVPAAIFIIYFSFTSLQFLQNKIDEQYYGALDYQPGDYTNTRFGSLLWDYDYIKSQPIFGNGLSIETRYRFDYYLISADVGNGNGFSNFIVGWGVPFFLFWLFNVYKFSYSISESKIVGLMIIFIIIFILQGEQFLNYPLFLMFFIFPVIYQNEKELLSKY